MNRILRTWTYPIHRGNIEAAVCIDTNEEDSIKYCPYILYPTNTSFDSFEPLLFFDTTHHPRTYNLYIVLLLSV